MTEKKTDLESFGALWRKESKNGRTYYSGTVEGRDDVKLLAFSNEHATEENGQPHVRLFIAPKDDTGDRKSTDQVQRDDPIPF